MGRGLAAAAAAAAVVVGVSLVVTLWGKSYAEQLGQVQVRAAGPCASRAH